MFVIFGVIIWFAIEKRRRAHFNRFWSSHHLCEFFSSPLLSYHIFLSRISAYKLFFFLFFLHWDVNDGLVIFFFALWQLHGMFCMIPTDNTTECDYWQVAAFWKYFLFSGLVFVFERILREVRSRHRTYISKNCS